MPQQITNWSFNQTSGIFGKRPFIAARTSMSRIICGLWVSNKVLPSFPVGFFRLIQQQRYPYHEINVFVCCPRDPTNGFPDLRKWKKNDGGGKRHEFNCLPISWPLFFPPGFDLWFCFTRRGKARRYENYSRNARRIPWICFPLGIKFKKKNGGEKAKDFLKKKLFGFSPGLSPRSFFQFRTIPLIRREKWNCLPWIWGIKQSQRGVNREAWDERSLYFLDDDFLSQYRVFVPKPPQNMFSRFIADFFFSYSQLKSCPQMARW